MTTVSYFCSFGIVFLYIIELLCDSGVKDSLVDSILGLGPGFKSRTV